ncbi:MAG TPA: HypC/HybG/HupF family hydrogenase formation chaperone [Candidatus Binataceae bacterium]|nr:HypC/HybG/HupF family hydrogenase formation chaperone [Candidatus Binataceae bacterium]
MMKSDAAREPRHCDESGCITCGDEAMTVRVLELLPDHFARVEAGAAIEIVSVMLVDAERGDLLLVHAGEAIAKVEA